MGRSSTNAGAPPSARALYLSLSGLKQDLADYVKSYNYDRIHRGRLTRGMIPERAR